MAKRLRNSARAGASASGAFLAQDKFHGLSLGHGFWRMLAWIVLAASLVALALTEDALAKRRPTVRFGRHDGYPAVWVQPAASSRELRRRTLQLTHEIHAAQVAWARSDQSEVASAKRMAEAARAAGNESAQWHDYIGALTAARRADKEAALRTRVGAIADEYARRGLLDPAEAEALTQRFVGSPGVRGGSAIRSGRRDLDGRSTHAARGGSVTRR